MKKKLVIIGSIIVFIFNQSCKKDLSLEPIAGRYTNYSDESMLTSQLAGIYNVLLSDVVYGQGMWGYMMGGADESWRAGATATTQYPEMYNVYVGDLGDTKYIYPFWATLYAGIERANVLLNNAKSVSMDSVKKARITGQAMFLRGYYYFLLVQNFGDIPYKKVPTSELGANLQIPSLPAKDIYRLLLDDMIHADSMVADISTTKLGNVVTKSAVESILARVYLYMAGNGYPTPYNPAPDITKYDSAYYYATKVIASGNHSLLTSSPTGYPDLPSYSRLFINNMQNNANDLTNYKEGIWDAVYFNKATTDNISKSIPFSSLGVVMGIACPSGDAQSSKIGVASGAYRGFPKLYNMYEPGDLRRDWNFAPYKYNILKDNIGTGYFGKDTLLAINVVGGDGTGASVTPVVNSAGKITSIKINYPGSGYTSVPDLRISTPRKTIVNGNVTAYSGGYVTLVPRLNNGTLDSVIVVDTSANTGFSTIYDNCVGKWRREYEVGLTTGDRSTLYTSCNFPIVRYADVLLMAAEAAYQKGLVNEAKGYYNQVRRRAFNYPNNGNLSNVDAGPDFNLQSIKDERYRELCFEGLRRSDLIRWGDMEKEIQALNRYNYTNAPTGSVQSANLSSNNFLVNPRKYKLFPKPNNELLYNSLVSQNPGW